MLVKDQQSRAASERTVSEYQQLRAARQRFEYMMMKSLLLPLVVATFVSACSDRLTADQISKMSEDQIKKITPEQLGMMTPGELEVYQNRKGYFLSEKTKADFEQMRQSRKRFE